jgi:hypothetical protein
MCGVAGIFNLNGESVSPLLSRKMTDAIAHRGPDGKGFYTDSFIGLGHRRLAIIDLSPAGHQPMATNSNQYETFEQSPIPLLSPFGALFSEFLRLLSTGVPVRNPFYCYDTTLSHPE